MQLEFGQSMSDSFIYFSSIKKNLIEFSKFLWLKINSATDINVFMQKQERLNKQYAMLARKPNS